MRRALATFALGAVCFGSAARAAAGDPAAESLFQEALELLRASRVDEACPKLAASHELEPRSGTLIVLASCHELQGKTATAWTEYKDAAELARSEGRKQKLDKALELAAAVEARLSRLRIDVASREQGLEVSLDGRAVAEGALGAAIAIDPGEHLVEARAPGRAAFAVRVSVAAGEELGTVTIPALAALDPGLPPVVSVPAVAPAPGPLAPSLSTMRPPMAPPLRAPDRAGAPAWAWVAGGTGLALAVVAVVFRVDQAAAAAALDDACGADRKECPRGYDFAADRAREKRGMGLFLGFGAGGLAALGASVLGFTILAGPAASDRRF